MPIRLDPWTQIKAVHWGEQREAIYLVTRSVFSQFHNIFRNPDIGVPLGTPTPPPFYVDWCSTLIWAECLNASDFYADAALFDENGQFIASTTQVSVQKPGNTISQGFGNFEVRNGSLTDVNGGSGARFQYPSGSPPNAFFPGYISGAAQLLSIGNFFGASGVFDTDVPNDGIGRELHEVVSAGSTICTLSVGPSSASYNGHGYTPIGARYHDSEQFSPGLGERYLASDVEVLMQRNS